MLTLSLPVTRVYGINAELLIIRTLALAVVFLPALALAVVFLPAVLLVLTRGRVEHTEGGGETPVAQVPGAQPMGFTVVVSGHVLGKCAKAFDHPVLGVSR